MELKINNKVIIDDRYLATPLTKNYKTLQELTTLSEDLYPQLCNPVYINQERDTIVVVPTFIVQRQELLGYYATC